MASWVTTPPSVCALDASYSVVLLRLSLGGIFFWFGLLKFFPALGPAEALATRTLDTLTLGISRRIWPCRC
jgi:hypothetical protein